MNPIVKRFGGYVDANVEKRPNYVRRLLGTVYSAAGLRCKYFPKKELLSSRQYIQWATDKCIADSLKHPERSVLVNLFMPCEMLHAMDIIPMTPEAMSCYAAASACDQTFIKAAESSGVPITYCSYHKSMMGMAEAKILPAPKCIINTTLACDANQLSFRSLAQYFDVPHLVIDVPRENTNEAIDYVAEQLRSMKDFLVDTTGRPFNEEAFDESIARSRRTLENYKKAMELRKTRYLSDEMTSELMSLFALHILLGTGESEKYTEDFVRQLGALPEERHGVRLIWIHTLPYWQDAVREVLNFTPRCEIAACDLTFDCLVDTTDPDPYRFMARRLVENNLNGDAMRRIEQAAEYARKLDADGVVWFCHWGCKATAGAANLAKDYLEKEGFPTLILDGDGCDTNNANDGQMVTRLEAFLELLERRTAERTRERTAERTEERTEERK